MSKTSSTSLASRINPHINELDRDVYYHLGLDSSLDLHGMFGDVKYVMMAGSAVRARDMIELARVALGQKLPTGMTLAPIGKTERYTLYKFGPIISVSHGMGKPSLSILLHELTKLLSASGVEDPLYIRIGTSGGLGIQPGTVIVSTGTVNGTLRSEFPIVILGCVHNRPTILNAELAAEIHAGADDIPSIMGTTMATDDFYEGQGRIDGCICEHTLEDKMAFLKKAHAAGVRNIEMESDCLVAFCTKMKIRCAVVCCALLNRLEGDQVTSTSTQLAQYSDNAVRVVLRYIQKQLGITPPLPSAARAAEIEVERSTSSTHQQHAQNEHHLKKSLNSPMLATAECVQSPPPLDLANQTTSAKKRKVVTPKVKGKKGVASDSATSSSPRATRASTSPVTSRTRSRSPSPSPAPAKNGRAKRTRR